MAAKMIDQRYMTALFAFMRDVASYEEKHKAAAKEARDLYPNQETKHAYRIDRLLRPEIKKIERSLKYMQNLRTSGSEALVGRARFQISSWALKRRGEYDGEWHAINKPGDVTYSAASAGRPKAGKAHVIKNDEDALESDPSLQAREKISKEVLKSFRIDFYEFNKSLDETILAFRRLQFEQDSNPSHEPFLDGKSMDEVRTLAGQAMVQFARLANDHPNIFTQFQANSALEVKKSLGSSGFSR